MFLVFKSFAVKIKEVLSSKLKRRDALNYSDSYILILKLHF